MSITVTPPSLPGSGTNPREHTIEGTEAELQAWLQAVIDQFGLVAELDTITSSDVSGLGNLATLNTVGSDEVDQDSLGFNRIRDIAAGSVLGRRFIDGTGDAYELFPIDLREMLGIEALGTLPAGVFIGRRLGEGAGDVQQLSRDEALISLDLSTTEAALEGYPIILDGNDNAIAMWSESGLNFVPDPAVATPIAAAIGETYQTLVGEPIVLDADDNALLTKRPDGLDFIPSSELQQRLGAIPNEAPAGSIYARYEGGNLIYGQRLNDGSVDEFEVVGGNAITRIDNQPTLQLITVQGQSLSIGAPFTTPANAVDITDEDAFILDGLLRADGVTPIDVRGQLQFGYDETTSATGIAPVDWAGTVAAPLATAAAPMAASLNDMRRAVGAPRGTVLTVCHGFSGVRWELIDDDPATQFGGDSSTLIWDSLVYYHDQAKALVEGQGMAITCPWHVMVHGTSAKGDASPTYYDFLVDYIADYRAMLSTAAISGDARFILTQSGADVTTNDGDIWEVKEDQLRFCQEGRGVLAAPLYAYPIWDNNVHPDGESTMLFAEVMSRAIAEEDAGQRWATLGPLWHELNGNTVTIGLDRRADEILMEHDSAKYGGEGIDSFLGFEATGAIITLVEVLGDRVRVTCDAVPTEIRYAFQEQDTSGFVGNAYPAHRGLLRTSYTWKSKWSNEDLYRWVPSFKITV